MTLPAGANHDHSVIHTPARLPSFPGTWLNRDDGIFASVHTDQPDILHSIAITVRVMESKRPYRLTGHTSTQHTELQGHREQPFIPINRTCRSLRLVQDLDV